MLDIDFPALTAFTLHLHLSSIDGPAGLRMTGEEVTHRTASPIIEESASDIYSEQEPNDLGRGSRTGIGTTSPHDEQFEMVEMEPSSYATVEEGFRAVDYKKEPSGPSLRPKLSTQEHIDADDLFFAFSADDDKTHSKQAPSEDTKKGRPLANSHVTLQCTFTGS
ncbi:hypothetical protein OSTOST_24455, partial [Ostertagia ostertagi]